MLWLTEPESGDLFLVNDEDRVAATIRRAETGTLEVEWSEPWLTEVGSSQDGIRQVDRAPQSDSLLDLKEYAERTARSYEAALRTYRTYQAALRRRWGMKVGSER